MERLRRNSTICTMKRLRKRIIKKNGYQVVSSTQKLKKKRRLRDFRAENIPESLAREGIMGELDSIKDKTYLYWFMVVLGFFLVILNITDSSFSIEFGEFKYGGTLIGAPMIILGIYWLRNAPKPKIDIKNITKD